jgi:hypothetical protein
MYAQDRVTEVVAEQLACARKAALKNRHPKKKTGPESIPVPDSGGEVLLVAAYNRYALSVQSTA